MEFIERFFTAISGNEISGFISQFFAEMYEHDVSVLFTYAIVIYFILCVLTARSSRYTLKQFSGTAPGVLTILGILGTFTGIFIALLDFDVNQINRSVPTLLEGLKIAFGTSILGLFSALIFRLIRPIITISAQSADDPTDEFLGALHAIKEQLENNERATKEGLGKLFNAISGDDDGSLAGQMQRLRAVLGDLEKTTKDGFDKQITEFQSFAEQMSKAFSEAIIEELKSVIREFNEKISEQFGENFKQLNEAVGKLLEWQENYKTQMDELKSSLDNSLEGIQTTETSLNNIASASAAIPENMEMLIAANINLNDNLIKLHEGLKSISDMREKAEDALPVIADKIDELTDDVKTAVRTLKSAQEEQLDNLSAYLEASLNDQEESQREMLEGTQKTFNDAIASTTESLKTSIGQLTEDITGAVETLRDNQEKQLADLSAFLKTSLDDQKDIQEQMLAGTQEAFNSTISSATESLSKAILDLDNSMQEEIGRVVREMAENLSGITEKFVEDYGELLKQSRKIVELAQQAQKDE